MSETPAPYRRNDQYIEPCAVCHKPSMWLPCMKGKHVGCKEWVGCGHHSIAFKSIGGFMEIVADDGQIVTSEDRDRTVDVPHRIVSAVKSLAIWRISILAPSGRRSGAKSQREASSEA